MNPIKLRNRHSPAAQDDPCHPVSCTDIDVLLFFFLYALRVAQQDPISFFVCLVLYVADHLRKIRMSDMRHDQPDRVRALSLQGTRQFIWTVIEFFHRAVNFFPRVIADVSPVIQHP